MLAKNVSQSAIAERKDVLAPDGLAKFKRFGKTGLSQSGGKRAGFNASGLRPRLELTVKKNGKRVVRGAWHGEPQLKPPPHRTIEQFGVVCRGDCDHVTRELIDLHQQERDDAFDLAGFVDVAALLSDRIELVKKQYARHSARIVEEARQPRVGFAEKGADEGVVANGEKLHRQGLGDGFSHGGLAVTRRARQQHAVSWLHPVGAEQVCPVLFFDQLPNLFADRQRQDQLLNAATGDALEDCVLPRLPCRLRRHGRRHGHGVQGALEAVCQDVMVLSALLRNDGLYR